VRYIMYNISVFKMDGSEQAELPPDGIGLNPDSEVGIFDFC